MDFAGNGARLAHNRKLLETVLGSMDALSSRVSWTDTLKSKILLGVWGEFPPSTATTWPPVARCIHAGA